MTKLKLKDYAIVATDELTGEAYCKVLSAIDIQLILALISDEDKQLKFRKVHGFELRAKE